MWQSKLRNLPLYSSRRILQQKHYAKSMKSTSATVIDQQTDAEKLKSTTTPNLISDSIKTGPYLAKNPKATLVNAEEQQTISFDDIPGPISLRFISKFWSMVPVMETEIIIRLAQYFLSGGKFFRGILSWGGNMSFFKKFFNEYGPVVRIHGAFGSDVVLLSRPEHACAIFRSEGQYPIRSCLDSVEKYRLECRKYRQAGPFLSHGPDWEKVRKSLEQPMQSTLTDQYDKLQNICDELVDRIMAIRNKQEEMPNNFDVEIYKWSLECLSAVTLNKKLGFLDPCGVSPTSDPGKLLEGLFGATDAIRKCEYAFHFWKFFNTPAWKSLVANCDMVDSVLNKYVEKAMNTLKEGKASNIPLERVSLLESLLLKEGIVEEDVMTVMLDMFLIGANATAHTVAFLLYHLARNPRCQIRLYEELKKYNNNVTKSELMSIKYLQACVKECLRLDPPMPILSRVLNNDVVIHHYRIPKGTNILFATHLNNMGDDYFEDATRFKPERWLTDELGGFGNEYQAFASMPFGHGPRACLAKDLAETEIAMVLFKICKKFRIEYNYGDIKSSNAFLASPTKPLKFRFINRI
ncbi:probable cytochrome P450 301a1, mitochondrial [Leptinotarsa decemlineata]